MRFSMKRPSFIANPLAVAAKGLDSLKGRGLSVERLIVHTGGHVRAVFLESEHATLGYTSGDRGGADERVPLSVYLIDALKTSRREMP